MDRKQKIQYLNGIMEGKRRINDKFELKIDESSKGRPILYYINDKEVKQEIYVKRSVEARGGAITFKEYGEIIMERDNQ